MGRVAPLHCGRCGRMPEDRLVEVGETADGQHQYDWVCPGCADRLAETKRENRDVNHTSPVEARELDDRTIDERIRELAAVDDELQVVAASDCEYAPYCQHWLAVLAEARTDA